MNRFLTLLFLVAFGSYGQVVSHFANVPNPDDIKVDRFNNVWVNYQLGVDTYRLLRISPEGFVWVVIETSDDLGAFGVNDNVIWIASPSQEKVYQYNHSGVRLDSVNLASASEIQVMQDGTWYVAQESGNRVLKYSPDNVQEIVATGPPLNHNNSLAIDENGMIYTGNRFNADIIRVNPANGMKTTITTLPAASPYSTAFMTYKSGNLYVASGMNCIYQLDTAGMGYTVLAGVEGVAGNFGGDASTALFDHPRGVAFSKTGDTLFVTDFNNNEIRRVSGLESLGVSELQKNNSLLNVYPNPSSGIVHLGVEHEQVLSAIVTDRNGRNVSIACSSSGSGLDLVVSPLSEGLYFVKVTTAEGNTYYSRFVRTT